MKTWFTTGATKGFGRVWAEAAQEHGDQVIATGRETAKLDSLTEKYGEKV